MHFVRARQKRLASADEREIGLLLLATSASATGEISRALKPSGLSADLSCSTLTRAQM